MEILYLQTEINHLLDLLWDASDCSVLQDSDLEELSWSEDEDFQIDNTAKRRRSSRISDKTFGDDVERSSRPRLFTLDKDGQISLPIVLGRATVRISIYQIGYIPKDPLKFHNFEYIYPIGFCSKRKFYDVSDGTKKCYYTAKILCGSKNEPRFQITHQSNAFIVENPSINRVFELFLSKFDEIARSDPGWPIFVSGEDFFGLDHPTVRKYIEDMPGASKCIKHQKFLRVI